jgi:ferredoxin
MMRGIPAIPKQPLLTFHPTGQIRHAIASQKDAISDYFCTRSVLNPASCGVTARTGPRLLLSGVVTGRRLQESGQAESSTGKQEALICTGCGRCIKVCPGGALGPEGVDAFRCRTVSAWVPPVMVPAVKWMLKRTLLLKCIAPLALWIARTATIRCSLCVTSCPNYSKR